MRITTISDTHSLHNKMLYKVNEHIDPNQENILIHAGDISNMGWEGDISAFVNWFQNIEGFDTKIFIAGNHDFCFETKPSWLNHYINDENLSQSDCVYLQDSEVTLNYPEFSRPIKIYGSPWQPRFFDWAFNVDRDKIHVYWEKIPSDTDILITHGPVYDILDKIIGKNVPLGCESLYEHIDRVKPLIHICGHIHSGRGIVDRNGTTFINSSICTENYKPTYKPIVIDLKEVDGNFIIDYVNS